MKKLTIAAAVALALAGGLAGCHRNDNAGSGTASSTTSMPNTANSENGTSSVASNSTGANGSGAPGATNGRDLANGNMAGTSGGTNVPGNMTGATSPGDYGSTSASANSSTSAMGAGANGQAVFSQTCSACHAAGIAGAPKVGDKAAWGPRIAQGKDVLYTHALNGFTGKTGTMPPKGGNTTLADADVKAAVDYMVAQAQK